MIHFCRIVNLRQIGLKRDDGFISIDKLNFKHKQTHTSPSNCRIKEECPMDGNCNSENVVYQANIFPQGR